eukprot:2693417-Ditylum_brightwellii.AAC.1
MGENAERENNKEKESESEEEEEEEKNEGFKGEQMKEQQEEEGIVSTIDENIGKEENNIHGKDGEENENDETMEDE